MTQNDVTEQISGLESKFMKIFLTLISVLLMFAGSTYVPYFLADILKVDYIASISLGALLFIVGLVVLVYLVRKKVIE